MAERLVLFDGTTVDGWRMAGPGRFELVDGVLESRGGMGLLWYASRSFADFVLDVDWRVSKSSDNSGVFVRFGDPGDDPWSAVHDGYEVQIHDAARRPEHRTGAVYDLVAPSQAAANAPGAWNHFEITCAGQEYTVALNGAVVTRFVGNRRTEGHVGLQNHDDASRVGFRRVVVTAT